MAPIGPQDPGDRKWAEKAQELEFNALENVKKAADKWATTIGSLTGLLGIITLIKGPEDIQGLTPLFQGLVGLFLFLTLSFAFASMYLAALAAQGEPHSIWATGPDLRRNSGIAAEKAVKRLAASRKWVIPAVVALTIAVGLTWFGQRKSDVKPTSAVVVQKSGVVLCGEITVNGQGGLQLKPKDNPVSDLNKVATLIIVDECP